MNIIYLSMISIFSLSLLAGNCRAVTAELRVCRELELSLAVEFIDNNKDLPKSLDEFAGISMMKKGLMESDLFRVKIINSLALVPGAPVIQSLPGIPQEYRGRRLFLVSREENVTKSSEKGRYAILIKPEELDSKPARTYSYFIPEEAAQIENI
ncbi:MAG: hypothetical protein ABI162_11860 [Luteolibacter sp.]